MTILANSLVALVAALHVYFLVLEMVLWTKPQGMKTFGNTLQKAQETAVMAANQGLYNGFLAAGLALALWAGNTQALIFCLACVIIAGLYGAATVSRRILVIQAMPAALALIAVLLKL